MLTTLLKYALRMYTLVPDFFDFVSCVPVETSEEAIE